MATARLVECRFLIPLLRDRVIADGEPHQLDAWNWLMEEMTTNFLGYTLSPGVYQGMWAGAAAGQVTHDQSRE